MVKKNRSYFIPKLKKTMGKIRKLHSRLPPQVTERKYEWFRDNYFLFRKTYVALLSTFSGGERLPEGSSGRPRIYEYAAEYCRIVKNRLNREGLEKYLKNVGESESLDSAEVLLFSDMFRLFLLEEAAEAEEKSEAEIADIVRSLRFLSGYHPKDLFGLLSKNEKLLEKDPWYRKCDRTTKDLYRHRISQRARRQGKTEREVIVELLKLSRADTSPTGNHIGAHLFRQRKCRSYFPCLFGGVAAAVLGVLCLSGNIFVALLSILPLFESGKLLADFIFSKLIPALSPPRLAVTAENCPLTLLTVITVLKDKNDADQLLEKLERYACAHSLPGIHVGFLADFPASAQELTEPERQLCEYLKERLTELNREYRNRLFGAVRVRHWDPEKREYSARERKRGAVCDFFEATVGRGTEEFLLLSGDIRDAKYFAALDADTRPLLRSVEKLIGVLEYPLSWPVYDQKKRRVTAGYAIASPRIDVTLDSVNRNAFTRILGGVGGAELYGNPSFNVYQDLFSEGIFAGKGLINIACFRQALTDLFPKNTVLSHDILEGNLLRCVYVSDVAFCDGIPQSILSCQERNHRWIRGDWQNLRFLGQKLALPDGSVIQNPMSTLSKYKLFDNLRRSLTKPAVFLCMLLSPWLGAELFFLGLAALWGGAILSLLNDVFHAGFLHSVRYHSRILPEIGRTLAAALLDLLCLPYFALSDLDAVCRALYRQATGRRLLEWTTAAQADKNLRGTLREYLRKMFWQAFGVPMLFFFPYTILGLLWLSAPFVCRLLGKPERRDSYAPQIEPELRRIWDYFARFLNKKNNFLPPDNYQEIPLGVEAERTSPTNIGLGMLSCLGAYDMGYISREEMLDLVDRTMDSLERLERWRGHPYNWYSTVTMAPLTPKYVSTVDNGNLAALLYALACGLREFPEAEGLAARIGKLLREMDFSLLYDQERDLFYIGYDAEREAYSEGYYDLYISEARLTSFYAVATRQVPLRHWRRLSRLMTKQGGYFSIQSWSGTMFEYFMPHLLLPAYDGALSGETLRAALHEQKKAVSGGIWGTSESGYYAFDPQMNYQYRAFGVPSLALKPQESEDRVISPYSTFLTLPFFPKAAMRNFRNMKKYPLYGKYGFYEAIDFSSARTGGQPSVVQSYMVHHLGMSFLSGVNALRGNVMQKRFMSAQMSAYAELLEEKLPAKVIKCDPPPHRQEQRERYSGKTEEYTSVNPFAPNVTVLSNRSATEVLTDSGAGVLQYRGMDVSLFRDEPRQPSGIFCVLRWGKETVGATFAPIYDPAVSYKSYFEEGEAVFFARKGELETRLSVAMHPLQPVSVRELVIKNNASSRKKAGFLFWLRPVLTLRQAYCAHPAFQDLFLEAEYAPETNTLFFHRRRRAVSDPSLWLGVRLSAPFEFEVSSDRVLFRGETVGEAAAQMFARPFRSSIQAPIQPCVALRGEVQVGGRDTGKLWMKCALGDTRQQVEERLNDPTVDRYEEVARRAREQRLSTFRELNINKEDKLTCDILLSNLWCRRNTPLPPRYRNTQGLEQLWRMGISGDFPLFLLKVEREDLPRCVPFLQAFRLMKYQDISCEMAICFSEGGSYDRPLYRQLEHLLLLSGLEPWLNRRNGIFLVNLRNMEDFSLLCSVCRFYVDLSRGWRPKARKIPFRKAVFTPGAGKSLSYVLKTGVGGFLPEGGFGIDDKNRIGVRHPWTHILSNPQFGTVLTDSSLGYTYAFNSYKNRLTPWYNDIIRDLSGEHLTLTFGRRKFDLVRNAATVFGKNHAVYSLQAGPITSEVTVFVPAKHLAKVIRVQIKNPTEHALECRYETEIVMSTGRGTETVFREAEEGCLFFTNALNTAYAQGVCCLFGVGDLTASGNGLTAKVPPGEETELWFVLGYARSRKQAKSLILLLSSRARLAHEFFKVSTLESPILLFGPSEPLNLLCNNFLTHQIIHARLQARSGFYQCSGAFGFRDQLQDSMCISLVDPSFLKRQMLRAAAHQFEEGDVMHWWHENMRRNDDLCGVRTRSADDLLWLPLALCEYVEKTADTGLLQRQIPYLRGEPLRPEEEERYFCAQRSTRTDSLYYHALCALRRGLNTGEHGLILFGGGDWNDGMNRVGIGGKGESVWVTMFAVYVLDRFAALAEREEDLPVAEECRKTARTLREALEKWAWDGEWYLRGFFDDGKPLGGHENQECRIDLIAQAFAALIGLDQDRVQTALASVQKHLVDREHGLVRLFTPAFRESGNDPGYIMGYLAGVRENGGQYTHAAIWYVLALYAAGDWDGAFEILNMINPVCHSLTPRDVEVYRVEPYAICADIYTAQGAEGRGGWSQYTGAAGWYFKAVTEELLGLKKRGNFLSLQPKLPSFWQECSARVTVDKTPLKLQIKRGDGPATYCDGRFCTAIPLDGQSHEILAII